MYSLKGIFPTPWVAKAASNNIGGYIDLNVILQCGFVNIYEQ